MPYSKKIACATAIFAFTLILSGFAAAAESAADIDRRFAVTTDQLNREMDQATKQIHAAELGANPNPYGSAADIDRLFVPTVGQANNELELATDQIHYMEQRDGILRSMNQYNTNSTEYQNLSTKLRDLDNNYSRTESTLNRNIGNVNAGLVR